MDVQTSVWALTEAMYGGCRPSIEKAGHCLAEVYVELL